MRKKPCWDWPGHISREGYGRIWNKKKRRPEYAHRVIYRLMVGPIPLGMELDHLCRNRRCFNPNHMQPVTHRENVLRGEGPAAEAARRIKCRCGRKYDRLTKEGWRICSHCRRIKMIAWRLGRKNA